MRPRGRRRCGREGWPTSTLRLPDTQAILLALTMTPALLLSAPRFFSASRRLGFSLDGCGCCCCCEPVAPTRTAAMDVAGGDWHTTTGIGSSVYTPNGGAAYTTTPPPARNGAPAALGAPLLGPPAAHGGGGVGVAAWVAHSHAAAAAAAAPRAAPRAARCLCVPRFLWPRTSSPTRLGSEVEEGEARLGAGLGCWARLGACAMSWWAVPILLLAVGAAAPCAVAVVRIDYVEGLLPMMPVGDAATASFVALQQQFGVGSVFATTLLIRPPAGTNASEPAWLDAVCHALQGMAANVSADLASDGWNYTMPPTAFAGLMMPVGGKCTGGLLSELDGLRQQLAKNDPALLPRLDEYIAKAEDGVVKQYCNAALNATKVGVTIDIDPFTAQGQAWVRAMRRAMARAAAVRFEPQASNASGEWASGDGPAAVELGGFHLTGVAPEQMDGAAYTFAALPRMVGVTLGIVCLVLGAAFRSALVPLRAVVCLVWMLCLVFGAAVAVYQLGLLQALGWSPLQPSGGDLFWMSPCIAFAIVVGLGLDYDVFFMESVVEQHDRGASTKQAVVNALEHTGGIICAAGVIMALAFGALLVGHTPALNQIGFVLVLGVLIDCFVTTKLIIPCCMALIPDRANLWPRRPHAHAAQGKPRASGADGEAAVVASVNSDPW